MIFGPSLRITAAASASMYFLLLLMLPTAKIFYDTSRIDPMLLVRALSDPIAIHAFMLSVYVVIISSILTTVLGVVLAHVLTRYKFPGREVVDLMIDLPIIIPTSVGGLGLVLLYGPASPLDALFEQIGLKLIFSIPAVILGTIFVTFPFIVRSVQPLMQAMELEEDDAAVMLGASRFQVFRHVTLPAVRAGIVNGVTLSVARGLGEFGVVLIVSGNILMQTQTVPLFVYDAFTDFDLTSLYAASSLLAITSIGITLLIGKLRFR